MLAMLQVTGHIIENESTISNVEIAGSWDSEIFVKEQNGKRQTLWKYKAPKSLDSR